jgi:N-acetylmuramoyl-L-alanine amidase
MTINSFDNESFSFSQKPTLQYVEGENKVYFDIYDAVLNGNQQNLVLSNQSVKEVEITQYSKAPNVVRVMMSYSEGFNPKDIHLSQLNNTLFVRFKTLKISNYYFQHIYSDLTSSISNLYENISIQTPVQLHSDSVISQINSAFSGQDSKNYTLSKKELILSSKYYINNVNIKQNVIHVNGIGSVTLSKPIFLTNPTRVAFDIHSAVVNPTIRNKEFQVGENETFKIGQFDKSTARVVITSPNASKYIPVLYGDTQHIAFVNKTSHLQSLFSAKTVLNSENEEINDDKTHSMKLVFSKPVIYGLERDSDGLELYLYNVEKTNNINLKKSLVFDNASLVSLSDGGFKLKLLDKGENTLDIHAGADGKTIRIKEKTNRVITQVKEPVITVEPVVATTPKKTSGKRYIVVDPGHGGSDCGATRNGVYEKDITLDVAKRTVELLKKKGYEVKMTRTADETVSLQERVEISEQINPDIFVSIHVNSSNSDSPTGLETHYYKDNSLQLAKTVHASLLNHVQSPNRGLFKSRFYVINHTTAPAILVEIGFISSPTERAQLVSESRKQATAKAIAEGISEYFKTQTK